jgi:hypothetical protein
MRACHLAFANTAIASRCSFTSKGPHRLCPPPCHRRRAWQRGQKRVGQRWPEGKIAHNSLALTDIDLFFLQAIHDLAVHEPSIFVPAFTELLPSILDNLLGPRLALRAQACHALGGLALAASQIPLSSAHRRLSDIVAATLTVEPAVAPTTTSPRTPSSKSDSMLIKTLRTTLGTSDPTCAAQGPVWALCTIAALVVLLGPTLVTNTKLTNGLKGLLALSVRHKKSSVRALACAVWRPLAWVYFRPPFSRGKVNEDAEYEDEEQEEEQVCEDEQMAVHAWTQAEEARRNDFWKVVATMLDMGAGVGSIGAVLGYKIDDSHSVSRAIALLEAMVQRGGNMCHDAVQTLCRLVSVPSMTLNSPEVVTGREEDERDWDWARLLPTGLFSADPGLLTVEFTSLSEEVRPVLKQTPSVKDVRALTATELWMPGAMDGLIKVWRNALTQVCLSADALLPVSPSSSYMWFELIFIFVVVRSLNSCSRGADYSRLPFVVYKARVTMMTMTVKKIKRTMILCRSSQSLPYR